MRRIDKSLYLYTSFIEKNNLILFIYSLYMTVKGEHHFWIHNELIIDKIHQSIADILFPNIKVLKGTYLDLYPVEGKIEIEIHYFHNQTL